MRLGEEDREEYRRDGDTRQRDQQLRGEGEPLHEHLAITGIRQLRDQHTSELFEPVLHGEEEQSIHGETGRRRCSHDDQDRDRWQVREAELHAAADNQAGGHVVRERQQEGPAWKVDERGEGFSHEPSGRLAA